VPLHQSGEIFGLLIAELEHDLDLAIREHAYIRGIFFGEEPVQALTLLEWLLSLGFLRLRSVRHDYLFMHGVLW